jgi:hypothetical protein
VAYWRCSAVVHGDEDDDVFYSRTIFKATESVFGLGWAAPGPLLGWFGGLHGPGQVSFPLFSLFSNSVLYFCFLFCYLNSILNSVLFYRF